ncbi:MAG TPA: FAD-dependent oxidoreductase [Gaiellaceae bacterium]|nr:FAD-dependent oxidoreductase [Gaiellaceae bacterium]
MTDYVVVGAGSAGCALAARLSEDPAADVLLLEAGGARLPREVGVPAAFSRLFHGDLDWGYETEPQPELDGRRIHWPRGKALGGSSALNAMMAIPGAAQDYDDWRALGAEGWSWTEVAPLFARVRAQLALEEQRDPSPLTLAFVQAARQAGLDPSPLDLTALDGVRLTPVTQHRGARRSAYDAYVRPAAKRSNLSVRTDAHVTRVVVEHGRAVGVEIGGGEVARARDVILCGGTVNTPQLLLLSGIGPAHELRRHGIPLVHDLPGVGAHLEDHLTAGILVESKQPLTLFAAERPLQVLRYLLLRKGMLTSNVGEAAAFVRTQAELPAPDLELIFAPVLFEDGGQKPPRAHGFTVASIALQPRSSGTLRLRSADPYEPPAIDPRYLEDPDDLRVLSYGVELARRIVSMPAMAEIAGAELEPGAAPVEDSIRARAHTLFHPVGTCRIGTDALAVVDPELRVRGIEGLRVVDASVMPRVPRGHTHLPTLMIAERAAELLRGSAGPRGRVGGAELLDSSV